MKWLKRWALIAALSTSVFELIMAVRIFILHTNLLSIEGAAGKLLPTGEPLSFGVMLLCAAICNSFGAIFIMKKRRIGFIFAWLSNLANFAIAVFFTHFSGGFFVSAAMATFCFITAIIDILFIVR